MFMIQGAVCVTNEGKRPFAPIMKDQQEKRRALWVSLMI